LATVLIVWANLVRIAETSYSFAIIGVFLLSSGVFLSLFGTYLPKADMRRRAFIICAVSSAFAGMGCLFFGVAPSEIQQKQAWIPMLLGLGSFASFQILLVYLFIKVRREQR
jgi:hypothetical protein